VRTSFHLASVAALCALSLGPVAALAQSSYTASTLSQPYLVSFDVNKGFGIDASNRVHGNRTTFSFLQSLSNLFLIGGNGSGDVGRAATWAPGTAATVSPTNVSAASTARPEMVATSPSGAWQLVRLAGNRPVYRVLNKGKAQDVKPSVSTMVLYPDVINDNGMVGGSASESNNGSNFAFVWKAGVMTRLPSGNRPEGSRVTAINNQDVAVGVVQVSDTQFMPARWTKGQIDLPTSQLESPYGVALKINDKSDILVALTRAAPAEPIYGLMRDGQFKPLEVKSRFSTEIRGLNNAGSIVGTGDGRAKLWKDGVEYDLTDLVTSKGAKLPANTVLERVFGINDSGSIVADHQTSGSPNGRTVVRLTAQP
jgi:hypothetical protein